VEHTFRDAFRIAGMGNDDDTHKAATDNTPSPAELTRSVDDMGEQSQAITQQINALLKGRRVQTLPHTSRKRIEQLLPDILKVSGEYAEPGVTATRLLNLVEHIASRSAYLALLAEYPDPLARVAGIV